MDMKKCPYCKQELPTESNFCLFCMEKLIDEEVVDHISAQQYKYKRLPVIVLCIIVAVITICLTLYISNNYSNSNSNNEGKPIAVWTMKLQPHGGVDTFEYCLSEGIIGFGWGLEGNPSTIKEYRKMREEENAYVGDTLLDETLTHFENMTSTNYVNLVWVVDEQGNYYICEITGPYQYCSDLSHDEAGIVNFAECEFYKIGSDLVPETVINDLNDDSGVISFVADSDTMEITQKLWEVAKETQTE